MTHTPGPWVVRRKFPEEYIVSSDSAHIIVQRMGGDSIEGDARLIAAAPELLSALVEIVRHCHEEPTSAAYIVGCAHSAIVKARGEVQS